MRLGRPSRDSMKLLLATPIILFGTLYASFGLEYCLVEAIHSGVSHIGLIQAGYTAFILCALAGMLGSLAI